MEIHIQLAGEQIGPFSPARVRQYLEEGLVAPTDLATREGMEDWQPVEAVLAALPEEVSEEINSNESVETSEANPPPEVEEGDTRSLRLPPRKTAPLPLATEARAPASTAVPARVHPTKTKSGRTAIVIEPPRPTTHLPPVAGFVPKSKQAAKLAKGGLIELRDIPGQPSGSTNQPIESESSAESVEPVSMEAGDFTPPKVKDRMTVSGLFSRQMLTALAVPLVILVIAFIVLATYQGPKKQKREPQLGPPPPEVMPAPTNDAPAIPTDPKTASDFLKRGSFREDGGDLDGALADFDKAQSLDPKMAEIYYRRGVARQGKSNFDGALTDYDAALMLNPRLANAYSNRGWIKQKNNDLDGALADYNMAVQLSPKSAVAHYNVGFIKMKKSDLDGAIIDFNQALDLDPKMPIAYYNRGKSKDIEGNVEGAMADYTQALTLDPKLDRAYCNRGILRQNNGDIDGALSDYNNAIDADPKIPIAYYNRGQIKLIKGDFNGALSDESQSISLDGKNGRAFSARGIAHMGKGDTDAALADLRKFCELTPRDPGVDVARLYIWILATQLNAHGTADQDLASALQNEWNSPPEEFTSKLANFLLGHMREDALIANAASPDLNREPGQYCKAWYFAGMKRLLSGDKKTANGYFQKSVGTNQKDYCEYIFAQLELQSANESASTGKLAPAN